MVEFRNPIEQLTQAERDQLVSRHAASAEKWLRTLIHYQLSTKTLAYITTGSWKNSLKGLIASRVRNEPLKYQREIDATSFEDIIYIVTHPDVWAVHFQRPLARAYPHGASEAHTFLSRIKDARNDAGHLTGTSARQVAQTICYSGDLIDSIQEYYSEINMKKEYNVPMIVRYVDSIGNHHNMEGVSTNINSRIIDWRVGLKGDLRPGSTLVAEIEVDPSFSPDGYEVSCSIFGSDWMVGSALRLHITNAHVGEQLEVRFRIITKLDWHRQHGVDDMLIALYRVLPPIK